jgi:tyrosinase
MSKTAAATRYGRVKQILNAAAEGSIADYGIGRPPWHLSLDELQAVEVYGVRMIAPAEEASSAAAEKAGGCGCGCAVSAQGPAGDAPGERHPRYPGRGAASGLVKGLRGQAPYDGSVFPRLPWGGTAVADDDVRFISDWIDDGCPAHDVETVLPAAPERADMGEARIALANLEAVAVRVSDPGDAAERRAAAGPVRQRMNLDCMLPHQVETLREAFRELYALNKWPADRRSYNNLALIHQDHCQHGWERFLPWHRVYLYEFEQAMIDVVPDAVMPYWDFTMPRYRPECPEKGSIIPDSFKLFLTPATFHWLTHEARPVLPAAEAKKAAPLVGTAFASLRRFFDALAALKVNRKYTEGEHRERFIDAFLAANSLWYPLRYPAEYNVNGKKSTIQEAIHYHYPSADDICEILSLRTFRDFGGGSIYNDAFGFLDQNPHNTMHIWTGGMNPDWKDPATQSARLEGKDAGTARNRVVRVQGRPLHTRGDMYVQAEYGDMFSNLTAGYDPIFWPIHANIDRLWWEWQQAHPAGAPADLDAVLTPWSYTTADTLDIARFGYEYVKSTHLVPVGLATPVGRFVSKPIDVPEGVAGGFATAEVRLHRVPQLDRSCFVRVFLNLPDANADTPIDHPGYAGYLAVFGHGECVGGPGHCGVPGARPYDLRPRSHNTPRNHRVNVTRTARALLEGGARRLQITLVVIGVDYCRDDELLRLEGVSLTFLD